MTIIPDRLPNRIALTAAIGKAGLKFCAEIGVARGYYSEQMCRNIPDIKLICVDPWLPSRNHRDPEKLHGWMIRAQRRLKRWDVKFMATTSMDAVKQVADESLDFVYIDALHDYIHVTEDITAWNAKVRVGGVIAGHDWGDVGEAIKVKKAVMDYVAAHKIDNLCLTLPCVEDINQSWYWVKHA